MIPIYVITLDDSQKFINFKEFYDKYDINYDIFNGVDARIDKHKKYRSLIHPISYIYTPKNIIGCALSHILLAKQVSSLNHKYTLILEDDTFPFNPQNLDHDISNIIEKFNNIDPYWDIINLHADGPFQNDDIYVNICTGSTAAYILSSYGANKLANEVAIHNIDMITSKSDKYKKYKLPVNIFWTDETSSIIRKTHNSIFIQFISMIISCMISFRGEKSCKDFLSYKLIYIHFIKYDLIVIELIYIVIFLYIMLFIANYKHLLL